MNSKLVFLEETIIQIEYLKKKPEDMAVNKID